MQYVSWNREDQEKVIELSRTELDFLIDEWILGKNAERDRAMLRRRLFDGITYERLAEEFDMSPRQTREIVHKAEQKLYRHIPG